MNSHLLSELLQHELDQLVAAGKVRAYNDATGEWETVTARIELSSALSSPSGTRDDAGADRLLPDRSAPASSQDSK